ncbi:MAG: sulfurtransferase TusA family protein [Pseudomonadota bacterium]
MNNAEILVKDDEIDRYEQSVQAFLSQRLDGDRFMAARLQQGVYGQRQDGVNMVRVKIPGGQLTAQQLTAIAEVLEQYARHDVVHITTRQDFQIHYVPIEDTPAALRHLARAGLTTREACGNTVRNITMAPLAGVCPRELVDITPFKDGAVTHFLRHPLTQHLPRKFKISFSGCECDCAQGMMHDLGVVAQKKDGRFGFKILAGGGLGHKPHEAVTVEEFIEEKDLLPSMEAVVSLHHRYSDRAKRAKARIKFLVDRFGAQGFVEKYKEEYARTKAAFQGRAYPTGVWHDAQPGAACTAGAPRGVFAQKQAGLYVFPISVHIGDITAPQLRAIAQLMRDEGLHEIRTTQDQNLILINVPEARLDAVRAALAAVRLGEPKAGDDVVACPGTSTCRLGITSSKTIGAKLSGGVADLRIRASGCHNGCAQPEMGDIGIYGEGKRMHGKLVPHYQMYFGGDGRTGGGIGFKSLSVPAARVETAVARVQQAYLDERQTDENFFQWTRRRGKESFTELLKDLTVVSAEQLPDVINDHGEAGAFKVLQLGGGECAGAAQELVSAHFAEAAYERANRNAYTYQGHHTEALECAEVIARLIGQSLLFVCGHNKIEDINEIAQKLETLLAETHPASTPLGPELARLAHGIAQLKINFENDAYTQLMTDLDNWTVQAAYTCQALDTQLDLSGSLPLAQGQAQTPVRAGSALGKAGGATVTTVDLSSYGCPVHFLKARVELGKLAAGDVIDFLLEPGDATQQVSESLEKEGHNIVSTVEEGAAMRVRVRKAETKAQAIAHA